MQEDSGPAVAGGEDDPGWTVERTTADPAEPGVGVGDAVRFGKDLADADVARFAHASGDTNPLHLDDEYAADTTFEGRVVHGGLVTGVVSAALARLPGLVVYVSQETRFERPVRPGDRVTATAEVVEDLGEGRYRVETTAEAGGERVVAGEAEVLVVPE